MNSDHEWQSWLVDPSDIVNVDAQIWCGSTTMSNDPDGYDFDASPQHVQYITRSVSIGARTNPVQN